MPDALANIIDMIMANIWIIIALVAVALFLYYFTTTRSKRKLIKRSEIEKQELIKRLKDNPSYVYRWFYKGNNLVGRITHLRFFRYVDDENVDKIIPSKHQPNKESLEFEFSQDFGEKKKGDTLTVKKADSTLIDMAHILLDKGIISPKANKLEDGQKTYPLFAQFLVKPVIHSWLKITNPISKHTPYSIIINGNVNLSPNDGEIKVDESVSFDSFMGLTYDMTTTDHLNLINEQMMRTDWHNQSSEYFVASQEQCVYDPERALKMATLEKEAQIEQAKRRGKMTTI